MKNLLKFKINFRNSDLFKICALCSSCGQLKFKRFYLSNNKNLDIFMEMFFFTLTRRITSHNTDHSSRITLYITL